MSRPPAWADALPNSARIQDIAPPMPSPLGSGSESVWRVLKLARTKIDLWIRSMEMAETISRDVGVGGGARGRRRGLRGEDRSRQRRCE